MSAVAAGCQTLLGGLRRVCASVDGWIGSRGTDAAKNMYAYSKVGVRAHCEEFGRPDSRMPDKDSSLNCPARHKGNSASSPRGEGGKYLGRFCLDGAVSAAVSRGSTESNTYVATNQRYAATPPSGSGNRVQSALELLSQFVSCIYDASLVQRYAIAMIQLKVRLL